jgi:hypothetical protein
MRGVSIGVIALWALGCTPAEEAPDCSEREVLCEDDVDNDCDGVVDCDDAECGASLFCRSCEAEVCGDGSDNDCDDAVDCNDSDCATLPSCGGAFVGSCNGAGFGGNTLELTGLSFEATAGGLRGSFTTDTGLTVELIVRTAVTGTADLATPPNGYLATCTHCVTLELAGKTFFPRAGTMNLTAIPVAPGEHLTGTVSAHFEEVVRVGNEVEPVALGQCGVDSVSFDGVLVASATLTGSGTRPSVSSEVGAGAGAVQPPPPEPYCGDGTCGSDEFDSCASDCACGASEFTNECEDGTLCPDGSMCITRGRCQCTSGTAVLCADGASCDANPDACTSTAWSCVPIAGGCGSPAVSLAVHCNTSAGEWYCPLNSACTPEGCACNTGFEPRDCSGALCTSSNVCYLPLVTCEPIPEPVCGNGACESGEAGICCEDCGCGGGEVPSH